MKALEKDRTRRYETANDFAADVMRYLTDQPVEACPPSAWYRFRSSPGGTGGPDDGGAGRRGLLIGTAVSTWQAVRAKQAARAEAEQRSGRGRRAAGEGQLEEGPRGRGPDAAARGQATVECSRTWNGTA